MTVYHLGGILFLVTQGGTNYERFLGSICDNIYWFTSIGIFNRSSVYVSRSISEFCQSGMDVIIVAITLRYVALEHCWWNTIIVGGI